MNITIMNGFIVECNKDGNFAIYEDDLAEKPVKIAANAAEMIRWVNTH